MSAPVFVVGLPRSGSTLLSKLLNESADIMSVNDLYYLQAVLAAGKTEGALEGDQAESLLDALLELLLIRGSKNNAFIGQFELSEAQVRDIRTQTLREVDERGLDWAGLMDVALGKASRVVGKKRWADKTPQNFMHMDMLRAAFAGARFIFLLRDPRTTLVSFKYAAGPGHDPRRYHPFVYALYWRTAARRLLREMDREDVALLRFEDIIGDVAGVSRRLGRFLDTEIPPVNLKEVGHNSSFQGKRRKPLTPTEIAIVQRVCQREMQALGYAPQPASVRIADVPELLWLSLRFVAFQLGRVLFSRDGRTRIFTLVRHMFRAR